MVVVAAVVAMAVQAVQEARVDTDDAAVVPDDAAGIRWAKTAEVDNESGDQATEEASDLWDSPVWNKNKNFYYTHSAPLR